VDALARKTLKDAVSRQEGASTAFAQAEAQFDDLLKLIVAKLDSAPPPDDPGENPTLDQMLAMLKEERKAAESLGIPNRPLNIQIMTDWLRQNSSSQQAGRGQQPGGQRQSPGSRAQARSAQQQARDNAARAARASEQARRSAQGRAGELFQSSIPAPGNTNEGGPKSPSNAWNTLASKLGEELRQGRDNVPPEQYRAAIEQYFNSISETVPASPASPASPPAPAVPASPNGSLP
jgi:type II secretory pathway pseudopilin PulG